MELLSNNFVLLAITFAVFYGSRHLQKLTGWIVLNPILITIVVMIAFLKLTGITYDSYMGAGQYIDFWLKPAVVAMAIPLHEHMDQIKKQFLPIFLSQLAGCLIGIISVVLIAQWMGAPREIVLSMAPKSVTTPIAIEICSSLGGIPSLTAAIVVIVGLFGAVFGFKILELARIHNPYSQGLGIGTASHAVGTSRALEKGSLLGSYSSLGLILNGILTALLAPMVVSIICA